MQIISVNIENILSFEKASLSFEDKGLCLVEGWNFDAERSNGAGKSAIFNCISFALYDKFPRKITATEILRRDTKKGQVTVKILCGEDEWTIIRKRPKEVKFYKNNIEQTLTQSEFESLIGLNYDQFIITVYNSQNVGNNIRFLNCSDSDKKGFLLKLLNLEKLDLYKKNSDLKFKELSSQIEEHTNKISNLNAKIDAYRESLIDENEVNINIVEIKQKIEDLNSKLIQLSLVEKPDIDKFYKLEEDIKNKILVINKVKYKRELLFNEYQKIDNTAIEKTCMHCGNTISADTVELHKEEKDRTLQSIKKQLDQYDSDCVKENELNDLLSKIKLKKNSSTAEYDKAKEQSLDIKNIINIYNSELNSLNLKLKNNSIYLNKINDLVNSCNNMSTLVDENKRELEFYKTISNIYSSTGAQAYILDSIIDYFNESVQKYMQILWPNMDYTLNSYKETLKGETVAKFSETLTMDGKQISIGSLSGGEYRAVSLCIDFALLDVINNQFNININPIILDEPFDGLDSAGKEIVISLLEGTAKDRQILVVDHASESKLLFSKVISVEKKNGISSIKLEV